MVDCIRLLKVHVVFCPPESRDVRQAMALVAHVLHVPRCVRGHGCREVEASGRRSQ